MATPTVQSRPSRIGSARHGRQSVSRPTLEIIRGCSRRRNRQWVKHSCRCLVSSSALVPANRKPRVCQHPEPRGENALAATCATLVYVVRGGSVSPGCAPRSAVADRAAGRPEAMRRLGARRATPPACRAAAGAKAVLAGRIAVVCRPVRAVSRAVPASRVGVRPMRARWKRAHPARAARGSKPGLR